MPATRIEVIQFDSIRIDFSRATEEKVDLVDVVGFLGRWMNPTHLVIELRLSEGAVERGTTEKWAIPIKELSGCREIKLEGEEGIDLNFEYRGLDQDLIEAVVNDLAERLVRSRRR